MTKEAFIGSVTEQIRCVRARDGIARELSDHITDQAAAYEEAGEAHEDAVERAVREMGDPVEVGVELDRIHRPQVDYKLIGMAFLFHIAGSFLLWKVSDVSLSPQNIAKQCVVLLLSFGVMTGMYFLDYSFIARYAYGIFAFATAAMLIGRIFTDGGKDCKFHAGLSLSSCFCGNSVSVEKKRIFCGDMGNGNAGGYCIFDLFPFWSSDSGKYLYDVYDSAGHCDCKRVVFGAQ